MRHDPSAVESRASGGGAGAPPGRVAVACRAGPGGDGAAVGRGLVAAEDRGAPGVLRGDGADGADRLPRDRGGRAATEAARPAQRPGAAGAGDGRARPAAGPGSDVDGGPGGGCAGGGGDRPERAPDAQVPARDGGAVAADGVDAGPQAGPGPGRAGRADARDAEKKAADGRVRLGYLDACGFSPSQPTTLTWVRRGERKRVPYESPQGRRPNVLAL